jgi:hypothetical protein
MIQTLPHTRFRYFRVLNFGFVSDFDIWISDMATGTHE